jgi:penicillin-binding protein-related factor A (putative recombinase)
LPTHDKDIAMENNKTKRANSFNTGIASEYLILSLLYRQGVEAYLSQGNKKSIDIRIIKSDGTSISVDVKSVRGYSSLVVNNVKAENNHFVVFVIYKNQFEKLDSLPDIYIVPSNQLESITEIYGNEKRVLKGKIKDFKDSWEYIIENYNE